jgi:hypothetical protein
MAFTSFVGIDVSKLTIDAALYVSATDPLFHQQFENRPSGFRKLLAWVHQHGGPTGLATFDWRRILGTFGDKPKSTHEEKTFI